jgi:5-methylcytosine-specific restriction endonuclease McrA
MHKRIKSLTGEVIAVDGNFMPMMTVTRRHAIKALATERAEVLCLETWNRKALYEITDLHEFACILYPGVSAIKDTKLKMGKGFRGILERDEHICQYCAKKGNTVDHVIPRSRGGSSAPTNLVCACLSCNQKKADRTPAEAGMPLIHPIRAARWRLLEKFHKLTANYSKKREEIETDPLPEPK